MNDDKEYKATLEKVPFDVFFFMTKEKIPLYLVKVLNPYVGEFYKCGGVYLQIDFPQDKHMSIVMAVGSDKNFAHNMMEVILKSQVEIVSFLTTKENKAVLAMCEYFGCKLVDKERDFFGENEDALYYELVMKDYLDSKRYKK